MLIKTIYTKGKSNSTYRCDMCNRLLIKNKDLFYSIHVKDTEKEKFTKKWDLCEKCYKLLARSIIKRKENLGESK